VQEIMPPISNIGTWWICWWTLVLLPNSCSEPRFDSNTTNSIIPIPRLLHYQLIFQSSTNHVQNQIICNNDCNTRILPCWIWMTMPSWCRGNVHSCKLILLF
jgi:hypothetical protein